MPTPTPLHEACGWHGNPSLEKTQELLDSEGTKDLEAEDRCGLTPLHHAASTDESGKIVELLIQHEANIDARTEDYETPLMLASRYNNPSATLVLLRHGANIKAQDDGGRTSVHWAFFFGHKKVAEIILIFVVDSAIASSSSLSSGLAKGLEEARNLVMNIRNCNDKTALDSATSKSQTEIIQWWEAFQRETADLQHQEQRLYKLERTDPVMDALWPHALHKAGKKSISHLWYFVHMKGPSLIAESNNSRPVDHGQALKSCQRDKEEQPQMLQRLKHRDANIGSKDELQMLLSL